jgi:hypothetical protein
MGMHLYHPRLRSVAEQVMKNCDACKREKLPGPQSGHMPPQEAKVLPWEEVALDLIFCSPMGRSRPGLDWALDGKNSHRILQLLCSYLH